VFAPHQDDETLACGGTIAKKTYEGFNIYIVFMTDGRNSHKIELGMDMNPSPEELVKIREVEARRADKLLGVNDENLFFLNFEDGTLGAHKTTAKKEVKELLRKLQPNEVYYPLENEQHTDHIATNLIVDKAIIELGIKPKVYQFAIWSPETLNRKNPGKQITIDISEYRKIKKLALQEYKSQITLFSKEQKRPILPLTFLKKFQFNKEVFFAKE
jgi:LmbE family N-acetylglucosaminyl deacetylase